MPPKPAPQTALLAFLKTSGLEKASRPGFAHALRLSYHTIDPNRISFTNNNQTLTYRYRLSDALHNNDPGPNKSQHASLVGLYTALMDELTTNACVVAGSPGPPGVSLQMQTELLPNKSSNATTTQEVDIINHVTKLGKTVSHTQTNFVCAATQQLVAFSSHVKYMPTGNPLLDLFFRTASLQNFYYQYVLPRRGTPPVYNPQDSSIQQVIESHLRYPTDNNNNIKYNRAIFTATLEHTNPFGGMHGGCHAMIMEHVAIKYAQAELKRQSQSSQVLLVPTLQAMQIEFLAVGGGAMDVVCETIGSSIDERNDDGTLHVRVKLQRGNRVLSEGKLRFSVGI